jgi:hypothetical protein
VAGEHVGTDDEHVFGATGLDVGGGDGEGRHEGGAGGAHVHGAGVPGAERVRDDRGRVGGELVLRSGPDEQEVESVGGEPRALERRGSGRRGQIGEALVRTDGAALADAGAGDDPVLADPGALGDRPIGDGRLR